MRAVRMDTPWTGERGPRLARLTRHWKARLEDFEPGGPRVLLADQEGGEVLAAFPEHDTDRLRARLEKRGVYARLEGENLRFFLTPELPFEDLDYAWGCLNEIY